MLLQNVRKQTLHSKRLSFIPSASPLVTFKAGMWEKYAEIDVMVWGSAI